MTYVTTEQVYSLSDPPTRSQATVRRGTAQSPSDMAIKHLGNIPPLQGDILMKPVENILQLVEDIQMLPLENIPPLQGGLVILPVDIFLQLVVDIQMKPADLFLQLVGDIRMKP